VVELQAETPLQGLLPRQAGSTALTEITPGAIAAIAPFAGRAGACSEALEKAGLPKLPAAGRSAGRGGARLLWAGRGQYLLLADKAPPRSLARHGALCDQSDGWAVMALEGAAAAAVMARLCPLDLRAGVFRRGHVACSELAHVMAVVLRLPKGFQIMVPRSFAACVAERVTTAMESVAARHGG